MRNFELWLCTLPLIPSLYLQAGTEVCWNQKLKHSSSLVTMPLLLTPEGTTPRALSLSPPLLPTPALHRINEEQDVCVFLSCWVLEVLRKRCHVADLPVGRFCLLPHTDIQDHAHKDSVSLVGAGGASCEGVEVRGGGEGPGINLSLDPWKQVEALRLTTRVEG